MFTVLYVTFQPRLQSALNKAFFPSRHDAYETLTRFGHAMVMKLDLPICRPKSSIRFRRSWASRKFRCFFSTRNKGAMCGRHRADSMTSRVPCGSQQRTFYSYLLACNQPIVKEELQQRPPGFDERLAATLVETMSHTGL